MGTAPDTLVFDLDVPRRPTLGDVDPTLEERSFVAYVVRVMLLGALLPRFRSRSLMTP